MRTLLELERLGTDKWRLRVRREDTKGNVEATVSVDGDADQIRALATNCLCAWSTVDEIRAQSEAAVRHRKG
jgi:hypothetical protein